MKIDEIELVPVACKLNTPLRRGTMQVQAKGNVLVLVRTNEGVAGLGEAGFSISFYPMISAVMDHVLRPLLIGRDPLQIGELWQTMYRATHQWGRRGIETYALSSIDIALWDIMGKVTGQPLCRLLGGGGDTYRAYAAPSLRPPDEVRRDCEEAMSRGFGAIKLRMGLGPDTDLEIVRTARAAVGGHMELVIDANMAYDDATAVDMARRFADEFAVSWLEEPILARSLDEYVRGHARLRRAVSLRLSGGESLFTRHEFVPLFRERAFDIVQPDATGVGGITEAAAIAATARSHGILFTPHVACSSGTGVGLAANLHVLAAHPGAPYAEYDMYDDSPLQRKLLQEPLLARDGMLRVPAGPGLGIELNPDALKRFRVD